MFKYVIVFSKTGVMCYTSHLDLMRMFKRSFKKAGIGLEYSKGFNPHPKMGFAQPLSLGYTGLNELMEIETEEDYEPSCLYSKLRELMPEGIDIKSCNRLEGSKKTLAAQTDAAEYIIRIPLNMAPEKSPEELRHAYMGQERIVALKRQKKKKEPVEIDIKPMIRELEFSQEDDILTIKALLDSGSISNLSPELLISTVNEFFELNADRNEMEITRTGIFFI